MEKNTGNWHQKINPKMWCILRVRYTRVIFYTEGAFQSYQKKIPGLYKMCREIFPDKKVILYGIYSAWLKMREKRGF